MLSLALGIMLSRRRTRQLTKREPHPRRLLGHDTRATRIERQQGTNDCERATSSIHPRRARRMRHTNKLRNRQQKERHGQTSEHRQDSNICPQRRNKEDDGQETPGNEVDTKGNAVSTFIPRVGLVDAEGGDKEHGKGEPKGAVGAVDGAAEGVADAELEDAGDELGGAAEKDGEAEDGLIGADGAVEGVSAGEAVAVSKRFS